MQSEYGLARRVPTHVRIGHEACVCHVSDWQTSLELDETTGSVDRHHERRRDDRVLARRDSSEVNDRHA